MKAEVDIAVVTMGNTTFYEVPELGTVAKVSKDEVTLIWGPEEGMTDRHQLGSVDQAHDMALRHAASLV